MQNFTEDNRLKELYNYNILEKDIHEELDGITKLASKICETPISLINLLDEESQITKSSQGWNIKKISRESSFCRHTILDEEMTIVENAIEDDRFKDSPFVKDEPNIRFYAGMPLVSNGQNIGALCVIDDKPRSLSNNQKQQLELLAREAVSRLELIKNRKDLENKNRELIKSEVFLSNSSDIQAIIDPKTTIILEVDKQAMQLLGGTKEEFEGNQFGNRIADEKMRQKIIAFINQTEDEEGTFIAPVRTKSGDILYLEHSFTLYHGKWFMTARDITNRETSIKELKATQQEKDTILNSASDCIITFNENKEIIQFNTAAEKTFKFNRNRILGKDLFNTLISSEHHEELDFRIDKYLETWNKSYIEDLVEVGATKRNGDEFPIELKISHLDETDPPQFLAIIRDITKRRNVQDELRRTLIKLNKSQELAEVGGWRWEPQSGKLEWTDKIYDIYGIEDVSTKPSMDILMDRTHPEDTERALNYVNQIEKDGIFGDIEKRLLLPDGTIKWVKLTAETKFGENGKPVQVHGAIQDITDQKNAQQKLKKEKQLSDKIIDGLPITFFMYDEDGNALRWNDRLNKQTGYNNYQISYMDPVDFFPEYEKPKVEKALKQVFEEGLATLELNIKHKDGKEVPFLFSSISFVSNGNNYFIGTGQNISELKNYQKQLKSSLKEKEILLSEVHHRVKNNLAIISGLLQMESFSTSDEHTQNVLQNSQMRIQSMAQIHELLYQAEDFSELSFRGFIKKIIDTTENLLDSTTTDITFDLDIEDIRLNVNQAIPCGLIINEIITNAYKHAFEEMSEGRVLVTLREQDQNIVLKISDNGRGLGKGFSIDKSTSLGFTLIQTLTRQLDANLEVATNNGAEFALTFEKRQIKGTGSSLNQKKVSAF